MHSYEFIGPTTANLLMLTLTYVLQLVIPTVRLGVTKFSQWAVHLKKYLYDL